MKRSELGIQLIQMDLRNARSRQKLRINQQRIEAMAVEQTLGLIQVHLRELKRGLRKLEKFEKIEGKIKVDEKKIHREAGTNLRLLGTYGKV